MNIHDHSLVYIAVGVTISFVQSVPVATVYRVYLLLYVHAPHESALQSSEIMSIKVCSFSCYTMQKHGGIKFKKFITPPTLRRDECPVSLSIVHTHTLTGTKGYEFT